MLKPCEALSRKIQPPVLDDHLDRAQNPQVSYHGIKMSEFGLLLRVEHIKCEIIENLPLSPLPNTTKWFLGMGSRRGHMFPVFNLHMLFGLRENKAANRILVMGQKENAVGISILELPVQVSLSAKHRLKEDYPLPEALTPHIRSAYRSYDQIWLDWDMESFFHTIARSI